MDSRQAESEPLCPLDPTLTAYTFARHVGFILDELSSQGLRVWPDEQQRWHWRWPGSTLRSARGFWAMGEALLDALIARYPGVFATQAEELAA